MNPERGEEFVYEGESGAVRDKSEKQIRVEGKVEWWVHAAAFQVEISPPESGVLQKRGSAVEIAYGNEAHLVIRRRYDANPWPIHPYALTELRLVATASAAFFLLSIESSIEKYSQRP